MDVYHQGTIRGTHNRRRKLTMHKINQTFFWENQELFLPAVYVGKDGVVLDICAKISSDDMATFLNKWDQKRRLSLKTQEDFEQFEADNPSSKEFTVELCLDDTQLLRRVSSSINWYTKEIFRLGNETPIKDEALDAEEWKNEKDADKLMDAYGCDEESCWHFERISYDWPEGQRILAPQKVSLTLQDNPVSITSGHFTTVPSCHGETIQTLHPITGLEYTLTLHECRQTQLNFHNKPACAHNERTTMPESCAGALGIPEFMPPCPAANFQSKPACAHNERITYPEYCYVLSYSISPEIPREFFDIRDCSESDSPRKGAFGEPSDSASGATAFFIAGKSPVPDDRTAISSLHFEPVSEIRWRMVFQIKTKEDLEISLPVRNKP